MMSKQRVSSGFKFFLQVCKFHAITTFNTVGLQLKAFSNLHFCKQSFEVSKMNNELKTSQILKAVVLDGNILARI